MTVVLKMHTPAVRLVPASEGRTSRETYNAGQYALNLLKDTAEDIHTHSKCDFDVFKKIFEIFFDQNARQTTLVLTQHPLVV